MSKHDAALAWAREHLGQEEAPMGSNSGVFVRSCQAATWLRGTGWPWCVAFAVKAWSTTGYKLPYLGAGAYAFFDWHRKNQPAWCVRVDQAKPGAFVTVRVGSGHMVVLEEVHADRTFTAIGGNQRDKVARARWRFDQVYGVVDPPEAIKVPPKPARKPVFEVVSSASGHKVIYVSGVKAISNKLPQILKRNKGGVIVRPKK